MPLRGSATQGNTSTSTNATVTVTSIGIQQNDLLLLIMDGGGGASNTFTYPSGFSAVTGLANQSVTNTNTMGIAWKWAGASEPSTYAVTSSVNDFQLLHCRAYTGRNLTTPFTNVQVTATNFLNSSPMSYSLTAMTAAAGDDLLIIMGNQFYDGTNAPVYTKPIGWSNNLCLYANTQYSPILTIADFANSIGGTVGASGGSLAVPGGPTNLGFAAFSLAMAIAPPTAFSLGYYHF